MLEARGRWSGATPPSPIERCISATTTSSSRWIWTPTATDKRSQFTTASRPLARENRIARLTWGLAAFGLISSKTDNSKTQTPQSPCHQHLAKIINASSESRKNGKSGRLARQPEKRSSELNGNARLNQRTKARKRKSRNSDRKLDPGGSTGSC